MSPMVGFCSECMANVRLTEAGGCVNGHAPSSVSNVYATEARSASVVVPEVADSDQDDQLFAPIIEPLYVEGGFGYPLRNETFYWFSFTDDGIGVCTTQQFQTGNLDPLVCVIPYETVAAIDIGGQGVITSDAGLIGGGFGLGALLGMAVASLANAATTKQHMDTTLVLTMTDGELLLRSVTLTPEQLRQHLSPVYVLLQEVWAETQALSAGVRGTTGPNLADELRKLADLRDEGVLTPAEFEQAKAKLLRQLG